MHRWILLVSDPHVVGETERSEVTPQRRTFDAGFNDVSRGSLWYHREYLSEVACEDDYLSMLDCIYSGASGQQLQTHVYSSWEPRPRQRG